MAQSGPKLNSLLSEKKKKKKPPLCPEQSCGSKKQSGELSLTLEPVGKQRALASTEPRATTVSADFFVGFLTHYPVLPTLEND